MTELTDLAGKYARQCDNVEDLRRTAAIAEANIKFEEMELEETRAKLKGLITRERPQLLIPINGKRFVLVHNLNGGFGVYAAIEIIEESK